MADITEQFKREGGVMSEQEYNLIAEGSSDEAVIDEALTSLKRKSKLEKIAQFIEASTN